MNVVFICIIIIYQFSFFDVTENGISDFEVNVLYMKAIKKRVTLARKVDERLHTVSKAKSKDNWLKRAAEEMDIIVDDDVLDDKDRTDEAQMKMKREREIVSKIKADLKRFVFVNCFLCS